MTLKEFVERHFKPNLFPTLKFSTQGLYASLFNLHLFPAFGSHRLCDIGPMELQRYLLRKMASGLGWQRTTHLRNLMPRVFTTARKWQVFAGENPALGVTLPPKSLVREKHVLTPSQIGPLLACLAEPSRTLVWLGLNTGLRIGEMLALRWQDVDLLAQDLRVERAYYRGAFGTPKTQCSRRTLPVPRPVLDTLLRLRKPGTAAEALIFQSSSGTPCSDSNLLRRQLKPAGAKLGMPWLSWHTLRRTHATLFQAAGGSLKEAQAQLGHARMSTTLEIYTLPIPAAQRAAVERLTQLLTNVDELPQAELVTSPQTARIQ